MSSQGIIPHESECLRLKWVACSDKFNVAQLNWAELNWIVLYCSFIWDLINIPNCTDKCKRIVVATIIRTKYKASIIFQYFSWAEWRRHRLAYIVLPIEFRERELWLRCKCTEKHSAKLFCYMHINLLLWYLHIIFMMFAYGEYLSFFFFISIEYIARNDKLTDAFAKL